MNLHWSLHANKFLYLSSSSNHYLKLQIQCVSIKTIINTKDKPELEHLKRLEILGASKLTPLFPHYNNTVYLTCHLLTSAIQLEVLMTAFQAQILRSSFPSKIFKKYVIRELSIMRSSYAGICLFTMDQGVWETSMLLVVAYMHKSQYNLQLLHC